MNFHSSPDYWLKMPLVELFRWVMVANRMIEREKEKHNWQEVRPGL